VNLNTSKVNFSHLTEQSIFSFGCRCLLISGRLVTDLLFVFKKVIYEQAHEKYRKYLTMAYKKNLIIINSNQVFLYKSNFKTFYPYVYK
jgi:hypothetical protein